MSTMYPLAIINTPSSTSLVRMTQYHHVHPTTIETSKGGATLDEDVPNVAQLVSDLPGERSAMNEMATESERKILP